MQLSLDAEIYLPPILGSNAAAWKDLFAAWKADSGLAPMFYGYWDPVRTPLNEAGYELVVQNGIEETPFFFRRKPTLSTGVHYGLSSKGLVSSIGECLILHDEKDVVRYVARSQRVATAVACLFGSIHPDLGDRIEVRNRHPWPIMLRHHSRRIVEIYPAYSREYSRPAIDVLASYIPDIFWWTLFGPPYVEYIGRDRLLSSPVFKATELDYGGIALQLTESPFDLKKDLPEALALREGVKDHLGRDMFFDVTKGFDYPYRVPDVRTWLQAESDRAASQK